MIIDEIKESLGGKSKLFWVGYDARFGVEASEQLESENFPDARLFRELSELLDFSVPYNCVPLTELLKRQWSDSPFRFIKDCHSPMPPYPTTAIELQANGSRLLCIFESSRVTEAPQIYSYYLVERALERKAEGAPRIVYFDGLDEDSQLVSLDSADWLVNCSVLFQALPGQWLFCDSFTGYFCDGQGKLLTTMVTNERFNARLNTRSGDEQERMADMIQQVIETCSRFLNYGGMVLNLMGCKNVIGQDLVVAEALKKARQRRNKPPLTTYKTLVITLPKTGKTIPLNTHAAVKEASESRALHDVAGHYADYREKGLFGRYKGVFWIPAHARGTEEAGQVVKTYEAKPANQGEVRDGQTV